MSDGLVFMFICMCIGLAVIVITSDEDNTHISVMIAFIIAIVTYIMLSNSLIITGIIFYLLSVIFGCKAGVLGD